MKPPWNLKPPMLHKILQAVHADLVVDRLLDETNKLSLIETAGRDLNYSPTCMHTFTCPYANHNSLEHFMNAVDKPKICRNDQEIVGRNAIGTFVRKTKHCKTRPIIFLVC